MIKRKNRLEDVALQQAIDALYAEMDRYSGDEESYAQIVDQLSKLYGLQEKKQSVSPDVWVTVGANLLGIVLIVGHERAHVVTSKAINFIRTSFR